MPRQPSERTVRRLGWVLLIIGIFLVGLMGTITWHLYPSMTHPRVADASGSTFTGTADEARDALRIFGLVIAFGLLSIVNGLWQIVTGRRNIIVVGVTLATAALLYFAARSFLPA